MDNNPISDVDPIQRVIDGTLGLHGKAKSFNKLLDAALGNTFAQRDPLMSFNVLQKVDKFGALDILSRTETVKFNARNVQGLFTALEKKGLSSAHVMGGIGRLADINPDANFYYNEGRKALFYSSAGKYSALPLQSSNVNALDLVTMGRRSRGAPLITKLTRSGEQSSMTWTDAYYIALRQSLQREKFYDIHKTITRDVLGARVGHLDPPSKVKPVKLHIDKDIIFFDLETTGKDVNTAEILELGYKRLNKSGQVTSGVMHFMPKGEIAAEALEKHGLSKARLTSLGAKPFEQMASEVSKLFEGAVVGGYNISGFDIPILSRALNNPNIGLEGVIDVYKMYKQGPGRLRTHMSSSLSSASSYSGIDTRGAHSAQEDIRMTMSLLEDMLARNPGQIERSVAGLSNQMFKGGFNITRNSPTLRSLLQSGPTLRGASTVFSARSFGLRQVMTGQHEFFDRIDQFQQARRAVAEIVKTGGRSIPRELAIFSGTQNISATQAMEKSTYIINKFFTDMPNIYKGLGLQGAWPIGKPDKLLEGSFSTIPTQLASRMFNGRYPEGMDEKGVFQLFKLANITNNQKTILKNLGDDDVNSVLSRMSPEFRQVTRNVGMKLRVAVLDFDTLEQSRQLFGDSGAFITSRGASKLGLSLPTGTVQLASPTDQVLSDIEKIFNVSLASDNLNNINKSLGISSARLDYIANTKLSKLQGKDRLYKRLYSASKDFRNVLYSMADSNATLSSISRTEGMLKMHFISSGASVPQTIETVMGLRRFTATRANADHPIANIKEQLAKELGVDFVVAAEDASKMHGDMVNIMPHSTRVALSNVGARGFSLIHTWGGARSDVFGDINIMRSARMTPGKMRTMALGAMMQGYKDPMDSPLYSTFAQGWKKKGIGFNKHLDLELSETNVARQFMKSLSGLSSNQVGANTVTFKDGSLFLGDKKLNKLPGKNVDEFMKMLSHSEGGIKFSDLEDTILDRNILRKNPLLHIDTGIEQPFTFVDNMPIQGRYIPFAGNYLRANKGVNERLVVTKGHDAHSMLKALKMMEEHPHILTRPTTELSDKERSVRKEVEGLIRVSNTAVANNFGGKGGLFEKTNTILLPGSTRVRLHAGATAREFMSDVMDPNNSDVFVSRQQLAEVFHRRRMMDRKLAKQGGFDIKGFDNVLKEINQKGFAYVMIGADPAQRPEHLRMARLRLTDTVKSDRQFGHLNLFTNNLVLRKMERDLDRDAIFIHFIDHLSGGKRQEEFAKLMARQEQMESLFRWIHKADLSEKSHFSLKKIVSSPLESMAGFLSQKTFAALGYTITRPVDAFMHPLISGVPMSALKMRADESLIKKILQPFENNNMRGFVAETLAQNLFQAGVSKGQLSPLLQLSRELTAANAEMGELVKSGSLENIQEVIRARYKPMFRKLLDSTGKNRAFGATKFLLEEVGESRENINRIEEALARGAGFNDDTLKLTREQLLDRSAELLADYYGGGNVILSSAEKGSRDHIMGAIYRVKDSASSIIKKVITPIAGEAPAYSRSTGAIISESAGAIATAAAANKSIFTDMSSFFSKEPTKAAAIVGAVGMGIGFILGNNMANRAITPIDGSQPNDYGPDSSSYVNRVKLYDANMPTARTYGTPANVQNVQKYAYNSSSLNLTMRDRTQPFNPQIARAQMDRISKSDFTY